MADWTLIKCSYGKLVQFSFRLFPKAPFTNHTVKVADNSE